MQSGDWKTLAEHDLDLVVDPMILRSGDLFLQGKKRAVDPQAIWGFLDKNLHSLGMFFDGIILHEQIPVFDYAATYDHELNLP